MKRNVIVFGIIAGLLIAIFMFIGTALCYNDEDYKNAEIIGYTSMIVSFIFIFIGIKNYRDKYNRGYITLGKAFLTGFYITLIASSIYVLAWLINYYTFMPDFMEKYAMHTLKEIQASGASQAEINKQMETVNSYKNMYKNPIFIVLLTYAEILPLGMVIAFLSALILKKKPKEELPQYADIE